MVKDAILHLDDVTTYTEIINFVHQKWGVDIKENTITRQIIAFSVNHNSRIYYPQGKKIRLTNDNFDNDLLFNLKNGQVQKYNPEKHGIWEIYKKSTSRFGVRRRLESNSSMFLFTWNPKKWNWDIEKAIEEHQSLGRFQTRWICASHKSAKPGDRAFIMLVGSENNGIFGSGFVISEPTKGITEDGKQEYFVQVDFEILFNPLIEDLLPAKTLSNKFEKQVWSPQSSGISIKDEYVSGLEQVWFEFLQTKGKVFNSFEIDSSNEDEIFIEGASTKFLSSRYERNLKARTRCIEFHGSSCVVCDINFLETYGEIGKGFIHVHHLTMLAHIGGKSYSVNPINDLRPVCPNCHAMLHTKNPPLSIDFLRAVISEKRNLD